MISNLGRACTAGLYFSMLLSACAPSVEEQLAISRDVTHQLASSLKNELQASIKIGGPAEAINICNLEAIAITSEISKTHGLMLGRTSLKIRNPLNAPDNWEQEILADFERQNQSGADISNLEAYEITKDENGKWFRYMKAIPTTEVCLMCHGEALISPVQEKLESLYPNDQAVGYRAGEIRGTFTVKQAL